MFRSKEEKSSDASVLLGDFNTFVCNLLTVLRVVMSSIFFRLCVSFHIGRRVSFRHDFYDAPSGDAIIESSSRQSRICIVTIRNGTCMFAAVESVPDAILAPRVFPDSLKS